MQGGWEYFLRSVSIKFLSIFSKLEYRVSGGLHTLARSLVEKFFTILYLNILTNSGEEKPRR